MGNKHYLKKNKKTCTRLLYAHKIVQMHKQNQVGFKSQVI